MNAKTRDDLYFSYRRNTTNELTKIVMGVAGRNQSGINSICPNQIPIIPKK
jgi:hypothetical protein